MVSKMSRLKEYESADFGVWTSFFDQVQLDAHNPHTYTTSAHVCARLYTYKEEIGRLSSLKCAGNERYHRTRMRACTLLFSGKNPEKSIPLDCPTTGPEALSHFGVWT
jgi:hypothetical protein